MSMGLFSYDEPPRRRHYCQLANGRASNGPNYWFAVARTKITSYDSRFNGDFRIIIYRNQSPRNYYAIPYRVFRQLLTPSHFDSSVGNGRWIGTIVNDILSISKSPHGIAKWKQFVFLYILTLFKLRICLLYKVYTFFNQLLENSKKYE